MKNRKKSAQTDRFQCRNQRIGDARSARVQIDIHSGVAINCTRRIHHRLCFADNSSIKSDVVMMYLLSTAY